MDRRKLVEQILYYDSNYRLNNIPLKESHSTISVQELKKILYEMKETIILKKCRDLWLDNKMQDAYDYFLSFRELFHRKVELAKILIQHQSKDMVNFFGDVYPLEDIDPVELSLHYAHTELIKLSTFPTPDLIDMGNILENINNKNLLEEKFTDENRNLDSLESTEQLIEKHTLNEPIDRNPETEEARKISLAEQLYDVTAELNVNEISTPITHNFLEESIDTLIKKYEASEIQQAIDTVLNEETFILREELNKSMAYAEQLFLLASEKGINFLREPININFELDEVDDIVGNYPTTLILEALNEIQKFEVALRHKTERLNTLETARKYLDGRSTEEPETNWYSYAPSLIKKQIKGLELRAAYDIVLAKSKEKILDSESKKLIMEYRFDLEEMIFGGNSEIEQNTFLEEFKEYPFEEYVRHAVEAIILPHIEVLEKIEKNNGQIQFVDIWAQNFSDTLKQQVRERDGFKCIVCDEETNLHVHHKIPRKFGGVNHPDNLVTLCSSCHGAIETADFEHAYQKCMLNAIKSKTSLQKAVDISKDTYLLKEEIKVELNELFVKVEKRDQTLAEQLLQIMRKIEYVFEG